MRRYLPGLILRIVLVASALPEGRREEASVVHIRIVNNF